MFFGVLQNALVRLNQPIRQQLLRITRRGLRINLLDCLDGDAAGFLPALVTTHSIRDNGETSLAGKFLIAGRLPKAVPVFVILALTAKIGEAGQLNTTTILHKASR